MTQPVNPTQKSWLNPLTILIAIIALVILTAIGVFAITRHGGTTLSVSEANELLSNISKTQEDLKDSDFDKNVLSDDELGITSSISSELTSSKVSSSAKQSQSSTSINNSDSAEKVSQINSAIDSIIGSLDSNSDFGDSVLFDTSIGI